MHLNWDSDNIEIYNTVNTITVIDGKSILFNDYIIEQTWCKYEFFGLIKIRFTLNFKIQ